MFFAHILVGDVLLAHVFRSAQGGLYDFIFYQTEGVKGIEHVAFFDDLGNRGLQFRLEVRLLSEVFPLVACHCASALLAACG